MDDLDGDDLADLLGNNAERPFLDIKLEQVKTNQLFEDDDPSENFVLERYDDYLCACAQGAAKRHSMGEAVTIRVIFPSFPHALPVIINGWIPTAPRIQNLDPTCLAFLIFDKPCLV